MRVLIENMSACSEAFEVLSDEKSSARFLFGWGSFVCLQYVFLQVCLSLFYFSMLVPVDHLLPCLLLRLNQTLLQICLGLYVIDSISCFKMKFPWFLLFNGLFHSHGFNAFLSSFCLVHFKNDDACLLPSPRPLLASLLYIFF